MKLTINIDLSNHKAIALLNYIKTLDFINIEEKSEQENVPKWQIKEVAKRLKKIEKNPLAILKQLPEANALVKKDRKIFLTLNARNAPILKMPNLLKEQLMLMRVSIQTIFLQEANIQ